MGFFRLGTRGVSDMVEANTMTIDRWHTVVIALRN